MALAMPMDAIVEVMSQDGTVVTVVEVIQAFLIVKVKITTDSHDHMHPTKVTDCKGILLLKVFGG